jgi:hypothetical protein
VILPAATLGAYLASCAPNSDPRLFASIVSVESTNPNLGYPDSNAIGDNTTRSAYYPQTREEAIALAQSLLARGHNLDLGLAQVNSDNLSGLGRSVEDAFDPCADLHMGEQILVGGWNTALAHYGAVASIFVLMDATASEYNSNTLTRSVAYMQNMNGAYNSQYVREAAYGAYLARANAYADAHHFDAAARARIQHEVLAMTQLVAAPPIVAIAPPGAAATTTPRGTAFAKQKKIGTLSDEGFSGVWH